MKQMIQVLCLGPGDPGLMTAQTQAALRDPDFQVILRTARHPAASWLRGQEIPFTDLDRFYDQYEDFDEMHAAMADWLWKESRARPVHFCVMDPVFDGAVAALKAARPEKGRLSILPGVGAADLFLSSLPDGMNPGPGLQVFSATDYLHLPSQPRIPILITELDSALLSGDVRLRLGEYLSDEQPVCFFPPSDQIPRPAKVLPLYQLDSRRQYDHTAALFVPGLDYTERDRFTFSDLQAIMTRLRAPDGCPWDRAQTHASLRPYLVEEAWEAVACIDEDDMDHLADELGDVLFQIFFHASLGESCGEFTLTDVVSGICRKMIQRHPHVFGASRGESLDEISTGWERRKRAETGSKTTAESMNDVSPALPSLKYAIKLYKKLAQLPALRRAPSDIRQEIQALAENLLRENGTLREESMRGLLLKCTELCYRTDQDAEILLHQGADQLKQRALAAEAALAARGGSPEDLTPADLEAQAAPPPAAVEDGVSPSAFRGLGLRMNPSDLPKGGISHEIG